MRPTFGAGRRVSLQMRHETSLENHGAIIVIFKFRYRAIVVCPPTGTSTHFIFLACHAKDRKFVELL
jgi:hypothetical protein